MRATWKALKWWTDKKLIFDPFWYLFLIGCFLHWIQPVFPFCYSFVFYCLICEWISLYLRWSSGQFCWKQVVVPMVDKVMGALIDSDIARDLWSLLLAVCCTFHLFPFLIFFFFRSVVFWFSLLTQLFLGYMIMNTSIFESKCLEHYILGAENSEKSSVWGVRVETTSARPCWVVKENYWTIWILFLHTRIGSTSRNVDVTS